MSKVTAHWHYDGDPKWVQQTEVPGWAADDGETAAAEIASETRAKDFEQFISESTTIVITSPEDIAGTYEVYLEHVPSYTGYRLWGEIEEEPSGDDEVDPAAKSAGLTHNT